MRTVLIALGVTMLVASAALAADQSAITACQLAATADGPDTDLVTLRALVQGASNAALQSTEPDVRRSATMLGRAARQQNPVGLHSALRAFGDTCRRTVGDTPPKSTDVAEIARELKDVLERTGEPDAACRTQQFGDGWTAVCE